MALKPFNQQIPEEQLIRWDVVHNERRWKQLLVSSETILSIVLYGRCRDLIVESGIPEDVVYLRSEHSVLDDYHHFLFYHPSWPLVEDSGEIPCIYPPLHKYCITDPEGVIIVYPIEDGQVGMTERYNYEPEGT